MTLPTFEYPADVYNTAAADEVLPFVFDLVKPKTVVDIGCGLGTWLYVAKRLGAEKVHGYDGDYAAKANLHILPEEFTGLDLRTPTSLDQTYDLAICLEVGEHLPDSTAAQLVRMLCQHANVVLFSAAIPDQGGNGHINEQWPAYWQQLFAKHGYLPYDILRKRFWNTSTIECWYRQNMVMYAPAHFEQIAQVPPVQEVMPLVHPVLYELWMRELHRAQAKYEELYEESVMKPRVYPAFRKLVKSLLHGDF